MLFLGAKTHWKSLGEFEGISTFELWEGEEDLKTLDLQARAIFNKNIKMLRIHSVEKTHINTSEGFEAAKALGKLALDVGEKMRVPIVVHAHSVGEDKKKTLERTAENLDKLAQKNIIAIENMPHKSLRSGFRTEIFWHPIDFDYLFALVDNRNVKICLDICHFFMSGFSYEELENFVSAYADKICEVHVADVKFENKSGSEGTQIGEGSINFEKVFDILSAIKIDAGIIPEIANGHLNHYAAEKVALQKLREFAVKKQEI